MHASTSRLFLLILVLALSTPQQASAEGCIKRTFDSAKQLASRPFRTPAAQAVGRQIKKAWRSKPVQAVVHADVTIRNQIDRLCTHKRRLDGGRFDQAVLALVDQRARGSSTASKASTSPKEVRLCRSIRWRSTRVERRRMQHLLKAVRPLFADLDLTDVGMTNPATGKRRQVTSADVENALQNLAAASKALRSQTFLIRGERLPLTRLLANKQVAAAVLTSEQPADRAAFLRRYRAAISTTQALSQAYELFLHWGGVQEIPRLAKLCRRLGSDGGEHADGGGKQTLLLVAARVRTPRPVINAARALTDDHFQGLTRLWLDPVMQGKRGAERRLRRKLPNKVVAGKLLDQLAAYRDGGAVKVVAVTKGQRDQRLEGRVHKELMRMTRAVAHKALKTDLYAEASKGTRDAFMPIILSAAALGYAVEGAAQLTSSPFLHRIQPTLTGGLDDVGGAMVNLKEMKDNKHTDNRRAATDALCAGGFGLLTSVLLSTSLPGSQAVSQLMFSPAASTGARVGASALYGGASSGGTMWMSTVGSRHYYQAVMEAVDQGLVAAPADRKGRRLQGRRRQFWAAKQCLSEHLSYTAQKWGLIGVGGSAVFTGACGLLPGWGGPAVAPILLGVGGAGETILTGVGLAADPLLGRRKARKTARELLPR